MPPFVIAITMFAALVTAHALLGRRLWAEYTQVKARLPGLGAAAFFLALAAFPLGMLFLALVSGALTCLGKHCHDQVYWRTDDPVAYWVTAVLLFLFGALLFSLALQTLQVLAKTWDELPMRTPLAGSSKRELLERQALLDRRMQESFAQSAERGEPVQAVLEDVMRYSMEKIAIEAELRRRYVFWKRNRFLVVALGLIVLVFGSLAAFFTIMEYSR